MEVELEKHYVIYPKYAGYRYLVRPNPDAPDCGVDVSYQEWNKEQQSWSNVGLLVLTLNVGELPTLIKAFQAIHKDLTTKEDE